MLLMPLNALARRLALELMVIVAVGLVVGYLGPFGTFAMPMVLRLGYWVAFGVIGYGFFRPTAPLARRLAAKSGLPLLVAVALVLLAPSLPMTAVVWFAMPDHAQDWLILLQLYGQVWLMGMLVFSLFIAIFREESEAEPVDQVLSGAAGAPAGPALAARLPPAFGPVLALKAEDHYVRVIGETGSTLLLMRLADAIGEMDGVEGVHSHRSWWVSRAAIRSVQPRGRGAVLHLVNGETAQVARDKLAQARALAGTPA